MPKGGAALTVTTVHDEGSGKAFAAVSAGEQMCVEFAVFAAAKCFVKPAYRARPGGREQGCNQVPAINTPNRTVWCGIGFTRVVRPVGIDISPTGTGERDATLNERRIETIICVQKHDKRRGGFCQSDITRPSGTAPLAV